MTGHGTFEIFLAAAPGTEDSLRAEACAHGWAQARSIPGGVTFTGGWPDVWRANLELRGPTRVLARFASFKAQHLSQLDKRARQLPWAELLRPCEPFRVEATCTLSKIYHSGAATERVERAVADAMGAAVSDDAEVCIRVRIDHDVCTVSVDTSGELLHKRGHKEAVNKAPMRETLAAMLLRQCGYDGTETVVDPMCGSGTFVIEAAEIAAGLPPGRNRRFAFERLATFEPEAWATIKRARPGRETAVRCYGFDIDPAAIEKATANARRADVDGITEFQTRNVSLLVPPVATPGLVIVNPPYGARLGDRHTLTTLYRTLGRRLTSHFKGWRVGLVTSDAALAKATGLPFRPPGPPIAHGGLRVVLYTTPPLA